MQVNGKRILFSLSPSQHNIIRAIVSWSDTNDDQINEACFISIEPENRRTTFYTLMWPKVVKSDKF